MVEGTAVGATLQETIANARANRELLESMPEPAGPAERWPKPIARREGGSRGEEIPCPAPRLRDGDRGGSASALSVCPRQARRNQGPHPRVSAAAEAGQAGSELDDGPAQAVPSHSARHPPGARGLVQGARTALSLAIRLRACSPTPPTSIASASFRAMPIRTESGRVARGVCRRQGVRRSDRQGRLSRGRAQLRGLPHQRTLLRQARGAGRGCAGDHRSRRLPEGARPGARLQHHVPVPASAAIRGSSSECWGRTRPMRKKGVERQL